jgi:hypothetical protein
MAKKLLVKILVFIPLFLYSQNKNEKKSIISKTNVEALNNITNKNAQLFNETRAKTLTLAKINNWPLTTFKDHVYSELIGVTNDNKPIYYSTYNKGAGITSRANKLYTGGGLGLNINGENMTAAVWDAGSGMPSHELFEGRLKLEDNAPQTHFHSAHVMGTIIGSELFQNGNAKGMAYKANGLSYDWINDHAEVATAASNGLLISNHSYGRHPLGVQINEWGKYDISAQVFDEIMFNAPYYQFVCAAGNNREYGLNTSKNGYDLITGHGISKNGITVAAVNEVLNYTGPSSVLMSTFSSWGPSDDGRIKPDISAKGVDVFSAFDDSTSSYNTISGTSMSSPSVAGTLLLFQQYYNELNNSYMKASTLKGLMIHTADEAGPAPGPDYSFGWGLINAEKAANVISKNNSQSFILEKSLNQSETFEISVNSLGTEPLIATLCWTDPKGTIPSDAADDPTPILVNDLDLKITQNDINYFPWKLDPAKVTNPASQGDNTVDNVEKVEVNNPSGSYKITIKNKGNLLNNIQNYSLIISGVTARDFWVTTSENSKSVCNGTVSVDYNFKLNTKENFNEMITFSAVNLPMGIEATFSPLSMNTGGDFKMTLNSLTSLAPGKYKFTVKSATSTDSFENEVTLTIYSPITDTSTLLKPTNNANSVELPVSFEWLADANAFEYDIQIASDSNFNSIIQESTVSENKFTSKPLINNSIYFWRVRSKNTCNIAEFSEPNLFTTVCNTPTNVVLQDTTLSSASFSWSDDSNNSSWEIEIVPQGITPSGIGIVVSSKQYTVSNLIRNSCYDFYIKSNCGTGTTSSWIKKLTFCTLPDYCAGDHFYDTGGATGNYQNNENYSKTIYPEKVGDRIKAVFNSFDLENGYDFMSIYNGPNNTYPLLYRGTGNLSPRTIKSSHLSGSLTFNFTSDAIIPKSGWDATIICEPLPPCPEEIVNFSTLSKTTTSATISWTNTLGISEWEIEIVPKGNAQTGVGIPVSSNVYIANNLTSNTWYDFYVRSKCSAGFSGWSNSYSFNTNADYCAGDHFYDNGGPNGDYPSYAFQNVTIYPNTSGDRVKAIFNSFELNQSDIFEIYNSTNSGGELLYSKNLNNNIAPTTIAATNPQGALTFYFSSSSQTNKGWNATIVCEPLPPCASKPTGVYLNNKTKTTASFYWTENSNASSWEVTAVPKGTLPTTGIIVNSNLYTLTGLTSNTWYDFYVRSKCSTVDSDWSQVVSFTTDADYCAGDHFYDNGGPNGDYPSYDYKSVTIYPNTPGDRVKAIFNSFELNQYDTFNVYNSTNSGGELLYSKNPNDNIAPTTIAATNPQGALTFSFSSSGQTNKGWDATIICEPLPPCASKPTGVYLNNKTKTTASFYWTENSNASSWEVTAVPKGTLPTTGIIVNSNLYTLTGLTSNTWYDFYVRSKCSSADSDWSQVVGFVTDADYCAGDHFYDNGGPNGDYPNYDYKSVTIYPNTPGDRVKAIFNSFELNQYDNFNVYNSTYSGGELLYSKNPNNNIAPTTIAATNPQGALTFSFSSSGQTNKGWDATIICEPLPPCASKPTGVYLNNKTKTTASFYWTDNSFATSWEVTAVPKGTLPATGITVNTNQYTLTGLTSYTSYDFYVRSKCPTADSDWSQAVSFVTDPDYCAGDHFYDNGGPNGNYPSYNYQIITIYPNTPSDRVKAIFNSFKLNSYDYFSIFDGIDTNTELLYSNNSNPPTTIAATNPQGALTFYFNSNSSQTTEGWDATIVCEPLPACSIKPSNINISNIDFSSATIAWTENSKATSWEVEIVPKGTIPSKTGVVTSSNPYTVNGLNSNSEYDFYLRSVCGNQNSSWSTALTFKTEENYCASGRFYDSGGPNGNYKDYENKTTVIYPLTKGNYVQAIFNYIQLENCCDVLSIYNGPDALSSQLLFTYNGTLPGILNSTHDSGALTFVFRSDPSITNGGWDATINCYTLETPFKDEAQNTVNYYPNPVNNELNIKSKQSIKEFNIYDINMRLISFKTVNSTDFKINLSKFSAGVYFGILTDIDGNTTQIKFVKNQ